MGIEIPLLTLLVGLAGGWLLAPQGQLPPPCPKVERPAPPEELMVPPPEWLLPENWQPSGPSLRLSPPPAGPKL